MTQRDKQMLDETGCFVNQVLPGSRSLCTRRLGEFGRCFEGLLSNRVTPPSKSDVVYDRSGCEPCDAESRL
jgi:hypothetical protein